MKSLAVLFMLFLVLGCIDASKKNVSGDFNDTSTSLNVSTTLKSVSTAVSTTTEIEVTTSVSDLLDCVTAPGAGCQCIKWACPTDSFVETAITTTTCVTIPDLDYEYQSKFFELKIKGDRFSPKNIKAMVGDIVTVRIISEQGLHKIRDTYANRTILIQPGESYEMTFVADREGVYLLTCNPFCEDSMEATITISQPYKQIC